MIKVLTLKYGLIMNVILKLPKGKEIYTDLRIQTGETGRTFRLVSVVKNINKSSKWIDKVERWHWILEYRYTENLQEGFNIEIDYNDNFCNFVKVILTK
jgi:hypothetical protein